MLTHIDSIEKIPWAHEPTETVWHNTVRASFTLTWFQPEKKVLVAIWQFRERFDVYAQTVQDEIDLNMRDLDVLDLLAFLQREEIWYDDTPEKQDEEWASSIQSKNGE